MTRMDILARHRADARASSLAAHRDDAGRGVPRARTSGCRSAALGVIGLVGAGVAAVPAVEPQRRRASASSSADNFASSSPSSLVVVGLLTIAVLVAGRRARRPPAGEYYALMLFSLAGMMLMAIGHRPAGHLPRARDAVARRLRADRHPARRRRSRTEAAFKYFLLGAFSSAFFLYGIAFTYGADRQHAARPRSAALIARAGRRRRARCVCVALGLLLVGLRVQGLGGAVPHVDAGRLRGRADRRHRLHVDRREGGGVRGVRARVPRRRSSRCSADWSDGAVGRSPSRRWSSGTVVGVAQTNVKRMLAYSSIAHARVPAGRRSSSANARSARRPILFYLLAYAVTNLGAFGVIALLGTRERANDELRDYAGLWHAQPGARRADDGVPAVARRLPADGGLHRASGTSSPPPSARATTALAIIGVLTSVVSVFFYLRVVVMMYMAERAPSVVPPIVGPLALSALAFSTARDLLPRRPADAGHRPRRGVDRRRSSEPSSDSRFARFGIRGVRAPGHGPGPALRSVLRRSPRRRAPRCRAPRRPRPTVRRSSTTPVVLDPGDDRRIARAQPRVEGVGRPVGGRTSATSRVGSGDAGRAAAADGGVAVDDLARRQPARAECCRERVGPRADRAAGERDHPQRPARSRAARPDEVLEQRGLERGIGQLVDAQRAHQRVRCGAGDSSAARPSDDARLRPAEQLVAAEADDVDAGGDASSTLHFALRARRRAPAAAPAEQCRCRGPRRPARRNRAAERDQLADRRALDEALDAEVRRVDAQDERRPLADGERRNRPTRVRLVVPTSRSIAPDCAMMSGTRKPPPISTSSPRETITSRPRASAASTSTSRPRCCSRPPPPRRR